MLDTCVILQVVWIVGVFRGGGCARLGHFITQKYDEGGEGCLARENAVLIKTIHLISVP